VLPHYDKKTLEKERNTLFYFFKNCVCAAMKKKIETNVKVDRP
jgi:hypothetical protein